jgi:hypothetical protein
MAMEYTRSVVDEAGRLGLREVQSMAYADLGAVCATQGLRMEAMQANYQAFRLSEDTLQRMRVLGDLGVCLLALGASEAARLAFEIVVDSNTSFHVRTNAVLELMDLESQVGNRVAFERRRTQAEEVRDRMMPSLAADYHFKTGVGLARFGRYKRAKGLLSAGQQLAEEHGLNVWYFKFESELAAVEAAEAGAAKNREPETTSPPAYDESPAIEEVADGLREYALVKD